ncbi:MAG: GMP synthase (glutamine-hydrolyzing), partial [Candidatus Baltobacteraceae bacterium]
MIEAARSPAQSPAQQATVFILDFGAQYSQLIARRTREMNVYCEIVPYDTPWHVVAERNPVAIILTGGPESTLGADAPGLDPAFLNSGLPILGICYGMQLLARDLGAELVPLDHREYGPATLAVTRPESPLFAGVPVQSRVWMSHGDSVTKLPPG